MANVNSDITNLYRQHATMLRHTCRRILGDVQLAEDIVQESFMQYITYTKNNRVEAPAAVLYRIATRLAVKKLRSRKVDAPIDESVAVDHRAAPVDNRIAIAKILKLVDEVEAQIALMHFVEGLSQDEIAELINVSRRTVGNRLDQFCRRAAKLSALPGRAQATTELAYDLLATSVKKSS